MSDSGLQSTELDDTELECLVTLSRDADELLARYCEDAKLRANPSARRSAFAAFEAKRDISDTRRRDLYYALFIFLSVVAALVIGFMIPSELKSVVWDVWGLASTILLLILTYGLYVGLLFWHEIQRAETSRPNTGQRSKQDSGPCNFLRFRSPLYSSCGAALVLSPNREEPACNRYSCMQ